MPQTIKGRRMRYTTVNVLTDEGWEQEILVNQFHESCNYRAAWCECPESLRLAHPVWNHFSQRYDTVCERCKKFITVG